MHEYLETLLDGLGIKNMLSDEKSREVKYQRDEVEEWCARQLKARADQKISSAVSAKGVLEILMQAFYRGY